VTESGRALIALYRGVEESAIKACQADIRKLMKMLAKP